VAVCVRVAGWQRPHFRPALAWKQIAGSIAFTVAACLSQVYFKADMSILNWLTHDNSTGIYTYAQRITEPLFMIAAMWGTAIFPALCRFSMRARDNYDRLMQTSARLVLLVAFPMGVGIAILARPIVALVTGAGPAEVNEAANVLRILCVVTPFFYLNSVGQEFLYAIHKNWSVVAAYAVASVVSLAGNLLLIPRLGVPGVALTAIAANAIVSVIFVIKMRSAYGAMGLIRLILKTLAACAAMAAVAYGLSGVNLFLSIFVAGLVYLALQALFKTLNPEERGIVVAMASAPFQKTKRT
jgi:O-antigen/teichoic acid export membrane protein